MSTREIIKNGTNGTDIDALLRDLSGRLDTFLFLLEAFDDFVKRGPFIFESLNEEIIKYRERFKQEGVSLPLMDMLSLLSDENFQKVIRDVLSAYKEVKENDYRTNIAGLIRGLTDEDIQRALAFIMLALKRLGENLK